MDIVRTPTRATGGITKAEKAALDAHAQKWIANAMSTEPVAPTRLVPAIIALYAAAGLKAPRVVIAPSPIVMAFAGGFAAAIWWVRKNRPSALRDGATDGPARFAALAREIGVEFGVNPMLMLQCARNWWSMYQGGNMWSYYDCYLSAFRDVLGLTLPEHEKYRAWEACAIEGGFRVLHEEFCIVSDRPEILTVDDQNRPHNATGPSHLWRDGWALYHWHGMRIPAELDFIIHSPQRLSIDDIERQSNSELRRVMIARYGPARFVVDSGAIIVDQRRMDDAIVGLRDARVLIKHVPDDEPIVYVDLRNSTPEPDGSTKRYLLRVDPNAYDGETMRNAQAAAASTWRNTDGSLTFRDWRQYVPAAES